jgi:quinol monooxygenase YgiN
MINVIASIHVKSGRLDDFLKIFNENVPLVLKEKGCIEYFPAVYADTDIAPIPDRNEVTIIEKWESPEALKNHLGSPHMLAYRDKVKDIVESSNVKVLRKA